MKNISKQYADLLEGKMSRDNFVRNCRQQFPQFISPVTSVDDAIKILKGKRIIAESMSKNTNYKDPYVKGYVDNENGYSLKDCPYNEPTDAALWKDGWMDYETEKQMAHDEETYRRETSDMNFELDEDDRRDLDPRVFKLQNQFTPVQLTNYLLQQGMQKWGNVDNVVKFVQKIFPDLEYDDILDMINAHKEAGSPTMTTTDDLPFFENKKKSLKEATEKSEGRYKETTGKDQYGRFKDVDNVNYTTFLRAIAYEVGQQPDMTDDMLPPLLEKVAKKMKKDPNAYKDLVIANYVEIAKQDEAMKMVPVKGKNQVDEDNAMEKIKNQENPKATPSKTENRKGKPEGVKEMGITPKKAKGITSVMDMPGKEKVLDQLKESLKKSLKEDTHYKYNPGSKATTPDGEGTVKEVMGGTVTVEFEGGKQMDYQVNTLDYFEKKKQEGSESFRPGVDFGKSFDKFKTQINDEDEFENMMKKYDWYAEMSDDSRKWDAQQDLESKLKMLAKNIGAEMAADIWNRYAPKDRRVNASYFNMRENKYSKLKEFLKKALKEKLSAMVPKGANDAVKAAAIQKTIAKAKVPADTPVDVIEK
jgi:ribosome modulation factor